MDPKRVRRKILECPICQEIFVDSDSLAAHLEIHSPPPPEGELNTDPVSALLAASEFSLLTVPAGPFFMGSDEESRRKLEEEFMQETRFKSEEEKEVLGKILQRSKRQEQPGELIYLESFQISKYPITNAQYRRYLESTVQAGTKQWRDCAAENGERAPALYISWHEAHAFCRWAGLRLPSEAQWERAARGTDRRIYPWGDHWDPSLCVSASAAPQPVGSRPRGASPVGCLDMAGNVLEWTSDYFAPGKTARALRGGAWSFPFPWQMRCLARCGYEPANDNICFAGFRCARDLKSG